MNIDIKRNGNKKVSLNEIPLYSFFEFENDKRLFMKINGDDYHDTICICFNIIENRIYTRHGNEKVYIANNIKIEYDINK